MIIKDKVETKFQLYVIPVIRVYYRLKDKVDWLDVDAITREIMKSIRVDKNLNLNEETKEFLIETGADVVGTALGTALATPVAAPLVKALGKKLTFLGKKTRGKKT